MNPSKAELPDQVAAFIDRHGQLRPNERVVVGLSGGADSVALLQVLGDLGYERIAVHVNYGLRGADSDEDENFARDFCARSGINILVHRTDLKKHAEGESTQVAARRIRYEQFIRAAKVHDAAVVAVAHHADDQAETLLLNLFRGTGPEGLAGMPAQRSLENGIRLVRPLLDARREQIEAFLRERGIDWREDATNLEDTYRRGFIRNRMLPLIEEEFAGDVTGRIAHAAELMRAYVHSSLLPELEMRLESCLGAHPRSLDRRALRAEPEVWRKRLFLAALKRWLPEAPRSADVAARIDELLESQSGRKLPVTGGTVWREQTGLRFVQDDENGAADEWSLDLGEFVSMRSGRLALEEVEGDVVRFDRMNPMIEYVDLNSLQLPITIRFWEHGDRFRPLGLGGSRLVSDFLTDLKVPSSRRRAVLVVEDANGILWVVGHRLDERARITDQTQRVAKLSFIPDADDGPPA